MKPRKDFSSLKPLKKEKEKKIKLKDVKIHGGFWTASLDLYLKSTWQFFIASCLGGVTGVELHG